jgi:hypothetical protein
MGLLKQEKQVHEISWKKTFWTRMKFWENARKLREVTTSTRQQFQQLVDLLSEIKDIQDELNIIKVVLDNQHSVLTINEKKKNYDDSESTTHFFRGRFKGKTVDEHVNDNRKKIEETIKRTEHAYMSVSQSISSLQY